MNRRFQPDASGRQRLEDFQYLSNRILSCVNSEEPLPAFLPELLKMVLEYSGCDEVELHLSNGGRLGRWRGSWRDRRFFAFEVLPELSAGEHTGAAGSGLERLRREILTGACDPSSPHFTAFGSFFTEDAGNLPPIRTRVRERSHEPAIALSGEFASLALIPLKAGDEVVGLLQLSDRERDLCPRDKVEFFENLGQTLGMLLMSQRVLGALRERLKELTCLYGITKAMEKPGTQPGRPLGEIAKLLPQAWQHPKQAAARIELKGHLFVTDGFAAVKERISAPIAVHGKPSGLVEVGYLGQVPDLGEGPFLKEEQALIDAVAAQIGLYWERRQAEEEKIFLQNKLHHADRLATIGQMAASVAHELNEPLSNILGFAQLVQKTPRLPQQVIEDLSKINEAVLHSREIVKKLLAFGRPVPQKIARVGLNKVVEDVLCLFAGRCTKSCIQIVKRLEPDIHDVDADAVQMNQVLLNLLSNAVQAMPGGGVLTVGTACAPDGVVLFVEDTGVGMDEEAVGRIFEPFFTTKKGEGTGLGLSVVRDIVKGHCGSIDVESREGAGTRFEVRIPFGTQTGGTSP
ncbi:MAG: hypothetical protein JXR96_03500 [Deltaproteobacteria bacterium]|nr:hypothetical protein [Deltaproteobacteria bacterium]